MKCLKNVILAFGALMYAQAIMSMEKAPQQTWWQWLSGQKPAVLPSVEVPQQFYMQLLPPDIKNYLLQLIAKGGNINSLANYIYSLNIEDPDKMLAILTMVLERAPYTAQVIDFADRLKTMKVMKDQKIEKWLTGIKARLWGGEQLVKATREGDIGDVESLLNHYNARNLDLNWRDAEGKTALMHAINPKKVALLLEAGVNVNIQDNSGYTALDRAAQYDNLEILNMLLAAGADPNIQHDYYAFTALMQAAEYGNKEAVGLFLRLEQTHS